MKSFMNVSLVTYRREVAGVLGDVRGHGLEEVGLPEPVPP